MVLRLRSDWGAGGARGRAKVAGPSHYLGLETVGQRDGEVAEAGQWLTSAGAGATAAGSVVHVVVVVVVCDAGRRADLLDSYATGMLWTTVHLAKFCMK